MTPVAWLCCHSSVPRPYEKYFWPSEWLRPEGRQRMEKYQKINVVGGLACTVVDSQEFSQVARSSRVDAVMAERREFGLYL